MPKPARRERLFRIAAGVLAVLFAIMVLVDFRGDATLVDGEGMLLSAGAFVALFGTYAVFGPAPANKLLAGALWLMRWPEWVWDNTVGRYVEMPSWSSEGEDERGALREESGEELE